MTATDASKDAERSPSPNLPPRTAIVDQRAVIDRRAIAGQFAELVTAARDGASRDGVCKGEAGEAARPQVLALLKQALEDGRKELARRLVERPSAGHENAAGHAFLMDQLLRLVHDFVTRDLLADWSRSPDDVLTIIAVGGYGRAEMSPRSDLDIAFITGGKRSEWCGKAVEAILYLLWDLGLKVGQSSRTVSETIEMAKADLTIRTALLEGRYVWGDKALYAEVSRRFWAEVAAGTARQFVTEKLEERNRRHRRMGDSRYVVEPNVKDGKGGLRDLQTLYWIGKFIHRVRGAAELVDKGLFTPAEYRSFRKAESFLLAVRAHLHTITGRAEDRLTFDLQRQVASAMNFADRTGKSSVERFMQFYFLQAKRVGSLTRVFLAHIDEEFAQKRVRRGLLAGFRAKPRIVKGYRIFGGTIAAPSDDWFRKDPVRLIEIFRMAEEMGLEIHPSAMRQADRDSGLIQAEVREDPRANALFLQLLSGRRDPETALRWMNEASVFGRFVPDFGRVNAQMQFDMYHHYTVDEHTIRAIGLVSKIERGLLADDHPRATRLIHKVRSRRAQYVAVLLHDIAKGRGGDHSELGAEIALDLCPRFGLDDGETQLVAWLVRQHLLMSATAFKRDLTDPKTIEDFVGRVQSIERLRHLAILTAVDIRAVGPGVWNSWKGQLLGELFDTAHERLRLGHMRHGRSQRVAAKKEAVHAALKDNAALMDRHGGLFDDAYWIAEPDDIAAMNIVQYDAARRMNRELSINTQYCSDRGATMVSVIASDHPGLFYRIAGGIHLAGASIIDARIHTTRNGWAVDNFIVQDPHGAAFNDPGQLKRIEESITDALAGRIALVPRLAQRPLPHSRAKAFDVEPQVVFDNKASNRFTVIEVHARDRSALLNRVARTLFENRLVVRSAHITNFGERAADTFYVTDLTGNRIVAKDRLGKLERELLAAVSDERQAELEQAELEQA